MATVNMNDVKKGKFAYISESRELHVADEISDNPRAYGSSYTELPKFVPYTGLMHCGYAVVGDEEAEIEIGADGTVKGAKEVVMALQDTIDALKEANGIK